MLKTAVTVIALLLLTKGVLGAGQRFAILGSYGFDWLEPDSTRCMQITAKEIEKFEDCRYSKEYSFGLGLDAYSCKVNARNEYILLKTKAHCQEALETMQANAP